MELDELHILKRRTGLVSQCVGVPHDFGRVIVASVKPSSAARREDRGPPDEADPLSIAWAIGDHAGSPTVALDRADYEVINEVDADLFGLAQQAADDLPPPSWTFALGD